VLGLIQTAVSYRLIVQWKWRWYSSSLRAKSTTLRKCWLVLVLNYHDWHDLDTGRGRYLEGVSGGKGLLWVEHLMLVFLYAAEHPLDIGSLKTSDRAKLLLCRFYLCKQFLSIRSMLSRSQLNSYAVWRKRLSGIHYSFCTIQSPSLLSSRTLISIKEPSSFSCVAPKHLFVVFVFFSGLDVLWPNILPLSLTSISSSIPIAQTNGICSTYAPIHTVPNSVRSLVKCPTPLVSLVLVRW